MLLIPPWIQHLLKLSPLWTGFALMSSAVVTGICSQPAGKISRSLRCCKNHVSWTNDYCGFFSFACLGTYTKCLVHCVLYDITWLRMGLSYMPSTTASLNSLHAQQQHLVTQTAALNNLFRRIFAAVAVVIARYIFHLRQQSLSR